MIRRSVLALAVSGALAVAASASGAGPGLIADSATATARAVRVPAPTVPADSTPPGRALLISDSAWLGMHTYSGVDQVQGFEHTLALASCRRRVSTSCTNYDGFVPFTAYEEVDGRGPGYTTLIVATGYNDSDGTFTEEVDAIIRLARSHGYDRVVWLTLRSNVSYTSPGAEGFAAVFERSNAALRRIVDEGTYPDLAIADWAAYSRDKPEWFASDGIHLRNLGGYAAGDYISRKIAFLETAPCPQPAYAGVEPFDPCPDPDAAGPLIDLESIYPVGQRDPDVTFTLSFDGSSSWPDPPWWER